MAGSFRLDAVGQLCTLNDSGRLKLPFDIQPGG